MTKGIIKKLNNTAFRLNWITTNKPISSWKHVKKNAVLMEISLLANGLFFARETNLSKSLSKKSFIQQPAPLITKDPTTKRIKIFNKLVSGFIW